MAETPALPGKREVVERLLARGMVFLHLDPRREGVEVPAWLKDQIQIVLQIGLDMPIPIPDLHVEDQGIFATLSFNRSPFGCIVPWRAIFAVVGDDGRGMVWPEDMPVEIAAEVEREVRRRGMAGQGAFECHRPAPGKRSNAKRAAAGKAGETSAPETAAEPGNVHPLPCVQQADCEASGKAGGNGGNGGNGLADSGARTNGNRNRGKAKSGKRTRQQLPPYLRVVK
jgi:stringent starvation protein B